jgi:phenylalanyl-tRNA synthetase beta chain
VIYDANRTVLSLPPIINGDHSKITLKTKNVFVEITALDKTKVEIVNHMLVAMFAGYAESIEAGPFATRDASRGRLLEPSHRS